MRWSIGQETWFGGVKLAALVFICLRSRRGQITTLRQITNLVYGYEKRGKDGSVVSKYASDIVDVLCEHGLVRKLSTPGKVRAGFVATCRIETFCEVSKPFWIVQPEQKGES